MSKPLIPYSEFAQAVADEDEDRFEWSDLQRFDYDAPKERCALVSWRLPGVDAFGEARPGHWVIVMAGDAKRWSELHDWGVLHFGDPPWRRSQVIRVVGRLGSVEAAVKALAEPAPDFLYAFKHVAPLVPEVRRVAGPSAAVHRSAAGDERRFRRAIRPEAERPAKVQRGRQGELF